MIVVNTFWSRQMKNINVNVTQRIMVNDSYRVREKYAESGRVRGLIHVEHDSK
jgi:hypothetical protein